MFELHQNVLINLHDGTGHVLHELILKYFKFNKMENNFYLDISSYLWLESVTFRSTLIIYHNQFDLCYLVIL